MKNIHEGDFEQWLREKTRAGEPEVSAEFLAAQRRGIYRRMEGGSHRHALLRWALSLAMLLVIVAGGVTFERRQSAPAASAAQSILDDHSDDQLFSDLSAMEQRTEPQAIQPIHNLFEE
jgi:hypothetical protein